MATKQEKRSFWNTKRFVPGWASPHKSMNISTNDYINTFPIVPHSIPAYKENPKQPKKNSKLIKEIIHTYKTQKTSTHFDMENNEVNIMQQENKKLKNPYPGRVESKKISNLLNEFNNQSKINKLKAIVSGESNRNDLYELSWSGVPSNIRPIIWKLLSGYLPMNVERRNNALNRKRVEYWSLVRNYYDDLNLKECDAYKRKTYHQIHIDVPRTNPTLALFQTSVIQNMLERILYVWAIRHPGSGYVQGINDLVTPFFVVFLQEVLSDDSPFDSSNMEVIDKELLDSIEADIFWCFSKFLDGIQDNYIFAQLGIQKKVAQLRELIKRVDSDLNSHLIKHNVDYLQFSYRWLNNLLTRELPLPCIIRLWDTYLAENNAIALFQIYICAAFLLRWKKQLMEEKDFQGLMMFLQNVPTHHWTDADISLLLAEAYKLKFEYADAPKHLECYDEEAKVVLKQ